MSRLPSPKSVWTNDYYHSDDEDHHSNASDRTARHVGSQEEQSLLSSLHNHPFTNDAAMSLRSKTSSQVPRRKHRSPQVESSSLRSQRPNRVPVGSRGSDTQVPSIRSARSNRADNRQLPPEHQASRHVERRETNPRNTSKSLVPPLSPTSQTSEGTWASNTTLKASTTSERVWAGATPESGGHRTEPHILRGIVTYAGEDEHRWLECVQTILQYEFRNPDLLEEALENPKSGVTCVGTSHRHFNNGNRDLAKVGEAVMKLVLLDQCYLFKLAESDASKVMDNLIGRRNLDRLGRLTKLEKFMRPRRPLPASRSKNFFHLVREDLHFEYPDRVIARGVKAILGAVYFDGGYPAAQRTMVELSLIIKLPE